MKLNEDFLTRMHKATQLLQTAGPTAATAAIQRVLQDAKIGVVDEQAFSGEFVDINPRPAKAGDKREAASRTFVEGALNPLGIDWKNALTGQLIGDVGKQAASNTDLEGKFLAASCTTHAGTRAYKLYIPSSYHGAPLPMIVMLHGCKQNPDDFAAGTGMNQIAEQNNCFIVYPAQAHSANGSNCWNWFKTSDQQRDGGEPSIIAAITRKVMAEYQVDSDRVYVAGLSAGGAMAAILAAAYPELYAAVGIHSGLPVGSAHDVTSAFSVMREGGKTPKAFASRQAIPAIVFHGDHDRTVHPANGRCVLDQCMRVVPETSIDRASSHETRIVKGQAPNGRTFTREIHHGADGAPIAEHWTVHGAGHAWSGGTNAGSYTDPKGPGASREMVRFFYAHRRRR